MAYRTQQNKQVDSLQPPQSLDVERAVLGCVLKDIEALHHVVEVLHDESAFYSPKNRIVYRAVLDLYGLSEPCDITTVSDALLKNDKLGQIGGRVYLVELAEGVASTANVESYARIVLDKFVLRRLIETSNEISRSCYALDRPVEELLDQAEANIFHLSERRLRKGFTSISKLIPSTFEQIEELQSPDSSLIGLKTGFDDLDIMTNGLHRGQLVIIAGRPSMGKTALAANIAEHVAVEQKKGVAIFSIEMTQEQLALRMLCSRSRISEHRLRGRKLRNEEWKQLSLRGSILAESPIFIDDSSALTSLEMRAKARRLKAQQDIGLVIVDYIQMMYGSGRFENRQQEISSISRSMKGLAKELDVPVIACSQLSRQVEQRGKDKMPQLSDLRESGAIEQDADVVMFVYRPEQYLTSLEKQDPKFQEVAGKADIIISKQRNGPTGVVHLAFLKEFARFESVTRRPVELPPGAEPVPDSETPF